MYRSYIFPLCCIFIIWNTSFSFSITWYKSKDSRAIEFLEEKKGMETPSIGVEKHERGNLALTYLTTRMAQLLNQNQTQNHISSHEPATQIGIKLNGTNYALWSQIVEMYISGKDKLGYINGDLPQPPQTDPAFRKWRTENAIVKGWLINSMDSSLVSNFIRFSTGKAIWDSICDAPFSGVR